LFQEQAFLPGWPAAGHRPQFAAGIVHAQQIGHERVNLRAVLVLEGMGDK
jgi:hypothetical protein